MNKLELPKFDKTTHVHTFNPDFIKKVSDSLAEHDKANKSNSTSPFFTIVRTLQSLCLV